MQITLASQPVALTLRSTSPQSEDVREITWTDLAAAGVGDTWHTSGSGSLYSMCHSATVTHRTDDLIVLVEEEVYQQDGQPEQRTLRLRHFAMSPATVEVAK